MTDKSPRPRNVVILDAQNPLVEVHGEFYWREDHEQLLAAASDRAFQDGFREGFARAHLSTSSPGSLRVPRRRRLLRKCLATLLIAAFVLSVVLTALQAAARL